MPVVLTSALNKHIVVNVDDTLYLLEEFDYILNDYDDGIDFFASNTELIIRGTVGSSIDDGIDIGHEASGNTVVIASTGIVSGYDEGIEVDGSFNNIRNFGKIIASKHDGVDFKASIGSTLTNFGEIVGGKGIAVPSGGDIRVFNHGQIVGTAGPGVSMRGDNHSVVNTGQIHSHYHAAVRFISDVSETNTFINSGTVSGTNVDGVAVIGGDGVDKITNQGMIYGSVALGGGNDLFYGFGGTVIGSVFGGAGDDRYFVDDPTITLVEESGEGIDTVVANTGWALGANFENLILVGNGNHNGFGNNLDNIINGNIGDNVIYGRGGNDILRGGEGNDTLYGGPGNDVLGGGPGNDVLRGGSGDDRLFGGSGDDVLFGGAGNDVLRGDNGDDGGDDVLVGGRGQDVLIGGPGADRFVYNSILDSPGGAGDRDRIHDFSSDQGDRIDLSGMDADSSTGADDSFSFIGTSGFSGSAGQLRYASVGAHVLVQGDVDGDGNADFEVFVANTAALSAGDFVL